MTPDAEVRMHLVYLKYWALNLMPQTIYPKVLFHPMFSIIDGGGGNLGTGPLCALVPAVAGPLDAESASVERRGSALRNGCLWLVTVSGDVGMPAEPGRRSLRVDAGHGCDMTAFDAEAPAALLGFLWVVPADRKTESSGRLTKCLQFRV